MKKILGSIFYLLLVVNLIWAEDYYFEVSASKKELFAGETAILKVSFFKKREIGTIIGSFKLPKSDIFDFKEYEIASEIEGEYSVERFVYLIKAEKEGRHRLSFFGDISIFSDEDSRTSSDHRDAMPLAATQKKRLFIDEIVFDVKKSGSYLNAGDFEIKIDLDETAVVQNEPVHFKVNIEGEGNIDDIMFPQFKIEGVKIFEQKPVKKSWIKEGLLYGKISKEYAAVSDRSFEIPTLKLGFFSTRYAKDLIKSTEKRAVEVRYNRDIEASLLDEKEKKEKIPAISYDAVKKYLFYLFLLALGYLLGKLRIGLNQDKKKIAFKQKIKKSKNPKELLALLLPYVDDEEIRDSIDILENEAAEGKRFKEVKKLLLQKI